MSFFVAGFKGHGIDNEHIFAFILPFFQLWRGYHIITAALYFTDQFDCGLLGFDFSFELVAEPEGMADPAVASRNSNSSGSIISLLRDIGYSSLDKACPVLVRNQGTGRRRF